MMILKRLLLVAVLLTLPYTALAAVPQVITYQGVLTDAVGTPVDGVETLTFSLYTVASGGVSIWSETKTTINVSKGIFKVALGSLTPFAPGTFDAPVYLGVKAGADPEMTPRVALSSAPFALQADDALHASDADTVGGQAANAFAAVSHTHTDYVAKTGDTMTGALTVNNATGVAVLTGKHAGTAGVAVGVWGETASNNGSAVRGVATATTGNAVGVWGESASPNGYGIYSVGNAQVDGTLWVSADASITGDMSVLGNLFVAGTTNPSDIRLKDVGGAFTPGLDAVMKLQPISYRYKKDNPLQLSSASRHYGFSAQDLQQVLPEAVSVQRDGYLQIDKNPVLWAMLNAIKELKQQQDDELAKLRAESAAQIAALQRQLAAQREDIIALVQAVQSERPTVSDAGMKLTQNP